MTTTFAPSMDAVAPGVALQLRQLSKTYVGTKALDGVDLTLYQGEVHALLGGNGSGKSTLIKVLAGVVQSDSGASLTIGDEAGGESLNHHDHHHAQRLGLRFVHQDLGLFPGLTVAENLALDGGFPGNASHIRWPALRVESAALLERLGVEASPTQLLGTLRPADRTMVAVARALRDSTESGMHVLCLDEVTASLPEEERVRLLAAIKALARGGQAVLMVTHRLDEVLQIAHRVSVLRDGRLVAAEPTAGVTRVRLVELVTGAVQVPSPAVTGSHAAMSESDCSFELLGVGRRGVGPATVRLRRGEILGLSGLEGCGAADILRLAAGVERLDTGEVNVAGHPMKRWSVRRAVAHGVAYVPSDRVAHAIFAAQGIKENFTAGALAPYWRWMRLAHGRESSRTRQLIDEYGVKASGVDQLISSLSGGNQQKVVLARWLHRQPSVLILDEPTQGVDVGARAAIYGFVRTAVADGMSVLMTSSDAEELAQLCDRVLVLDEGRVVAELGDDDITASAIRHASYRHEES